MKLRIFVILVLIVTTFSCKKTSTQKAKKIEILKIEYENTKQGFNPLKHGFNCDSLTVKPNVKNNITENIVISLGAMPIDTIDISDKKISAISEKDFIITDFNFDGFCDFVIVDIASANHGGINHYYYLYDNEKFSYTENVSIPKFIASFKMDIKNNRVKIYCPYEDCYAYYSYIKGKNIFELVKGKYEVSP